MKKNYKVGEFARNLGVTIGFLKHHEADGILKPNISPSGYRYYEYGQAMQALQCLRLQSIGFSSKDVSEMLNNSINANIAEKIHQKKEELKEDIYFYQALLNYLEENAIEQHMSPTAAPYEDWCVITPKPFYYLENSAEGAFLPDPDNKAYEVICSWNRYMPMTGLATHLILGPDAPATLSVQRWDMGLYISKEDAEHFDVTLNDRVKLIQPGKCLIYSFAGSRPRKKGRSHISDMLERPLQICQEHHFSMAGDIYALNKFASTANDYNYVNESVIIPI